MRPDRPEHRFLLRAAELLHAYGTPANRLERVLRIMAASMQVNAAFLVTPTSVVTSFGRGIDEQTHLLRIESGDVNLGKLVEFDHVMEEVEHGRISIEEGITELDRVAAAGSRYPAVLKALAVGVVAAGAARLFGGGLPEMAVSFALGWVVFALSIVLPRRPSGVELFEPLAAFVAAASALLLARVIPLDHRIVTLSSLIILLPGLSLTTALTELATKHLVSGVARLAGAAAVFLTILLGVALAWRLDVVLPPALAHSPMPPEWWSEVLVIATAPFAFAVVFDARPREFLTILFVCASGYFAARSSVTMMGADLAAFLGALVVGVLSNAYARQFNHPALVPQIPGILLLVPGSLGYRSLVAFLDRESLAGMEGAFQAGLVAVALVGGLLTASALLPPRRSL